MVLDVKAMSWASENGIDTATLKRHKIPIYGKWYFPDLPAGVPLVNLENGHLQTFRTPMRGGEILYVLRDDLRRARLGPYASWTEPSATTTAAEGAAAAVAAEAAEREPARRVEVIPPGIHMPSPSIYPLVVGVGMAITLLGLVAGEIPVRIMVTLLGLLWAVVGGVGWAVQGQRDRDAHAEAVEHDGTGAG